MQTEKTSARPAGTKALFVNAPVELMEDLDAMLADRQRDPMHRRDTRTDMVLEVLFKAVQAWKRQSGKSSE